MDTINVKPTSVKVEKAPFKFWSSYWKNLKRIVNNLVDASIALTGPMMVFEGIGGIILGHGLLMGMGIGGFISLWVPLCAIVASPIAALIQTTCQWIWSKF